MKNKPGSSQTLSFEKMINKIGNEKISLKKSQTESDLEVCRQLRQNSFGVEEDGRGRIYDQICDHVLLWDNKNDCPIGCYRIVHEKNLGDSQEFYSESEFNIKKWRQNNKFKAELSRLCIREEYRGNMVLDIMWRSIGLYVLCHGIEQMFGVVSFAGVPDRAFLKSYLWLRQSFSYQGVNSPESLAIRRNRRVVEEFTEDKNFDNSISIPALLRGYLMLGGKIGEGFFYDEYFKCTDIFIILDFECIPIRYLNRLFRKINGDRKVNYGLSFS